MQRRRPARATPSRCCLPSERPLCGAGRHAAVLRACVPAALLASPRALATAAAGVFASAAAAARGNPAASCACPSAGAPASPCVPSSLPTTHPCSLQRRQPRGAARGAHRCRGGPAQRLFRHRQPHPHDVPKAAAGSHRARCRQQVHRCLGRHAHQARRAAGRPLSPGCGRQASAGNVWGRGGVATALPTLCRYRCTLLVCVAV